MADRASHNPDIQPLHDGEGHVVAYVEDIGGQIGPEVRQPDGSVDRPHRDPEGRRYYDLEGNVIGQEAVQALETPIADPTDLIPGERLGRAAIDGARWAVRAARAAEGARSVRGLLRLERSASRMARAAGAAEGARSVRGLLRLERSASRMARGGQQLEAGAASGGRALGAGPHPGTRLPEPAITPPRPIRPDPTVPATPATPRPPAAPATPSPTAQRTPTPRGDHRAMQLSQVNPLQAGGPQPSRFSAQPIGSRPAPVNRPMEMPAIGDAPIGGTPPQGWQAHEIGRGPSPRGTNPVDPHAPTQPAITPPNLPTTTPPTGPPHGPNRTPTNPSFPSPPPRPDIPSRTPTNPGFPGPSPRTPVDPHAPTQPAITPPNLPTTTPPTGPPHGPNQTPTRTHLAGPPPPNPVDHPLRGQPQGHAVSGVPIQASRAAARYVREQGSTPAAEETARQFIDANRRIDLVPGGSGAAAGMFDEVITGLRNQGEHELADQILRNHGLDPSTYGSRPPH